MTQKIIFICLFFFLCSPAFSENLIKNPDGQDGFSHWQIIRNGGDGWQAPSSVWGDGFGTSYRLSSKKQIIYLSNNSALQTALRNNQEVVLSAIEQYTKTYCGTIPSDWWSKAVNPQKADQYYLTLRAKDRTGKTIAEKTTGKINVTAQNECQWSTAEWHTAGTGFLITRQQAQSIDYLEFEHGGISAEYWLGWYGPRMRHAELTWKVLPPDPGEEGSKTLAGIDSNENGVRDDVERFIAQEFSGQPLFARTEMLSSATNQQLLAVGSHQAAPEKMKALAREIELQTDCQSYLNPRKDDFSDYTNAKKIRSVLLNTKERIIAYIKANAQFPIDGFSALGDGKTACQALGIIK